MTDGRMSRTLVSLARRRGRLPALVAALGIAAVLLAQRALTLLLVLPLLSGFSPSDIVDYLLQALPFALGVFLGLWLIAPLADELTLPFVFTRGALATAAGAILVIIAQLVIALVAALDGGDLRRDALLSLVAGASAFVSHLILVLFASVLLWLWLRAHPRDYAVSGLIDEV
jgi:hypothetical protein